MITVKKPVLFDCRVAALENCFPMIPSGKAHNEMLLPDRGHRRSHRQRLRRRQGAGVSGQETTTMNQPASAYFLEERHDPSETHTLSVLVANEPGVLARVIGLFSGRGYNIESLTVSETEQPEASLAHHHRHHAARRW